MRISRAGIQLPIILSATILLSGCLAPEKIDAELKYLEIAISKTAGPRELEAWGWLMERVTAFRSGDADAARKR